MKTSTMFTGLMNAALLFFAFPLRFKRHIHYAGECISKKKEDKGTSKKRAPPPLPPIPRAVVKPRHPHLRVSIFVLSESREISCRDRTVARRNLNKSSYSFTLPSSHRCWRIISSVPNHNSEIFGIYEHIPATLPQTVLRTLLILPI